ncbi:MAG TPA: CHAP domain-containing protein [Chloroflexota bacterium]|nr:CHAP domain-containing protein [Chloroflexota bacterium]
MRRILAALGFAVCFLGMPMQAGTAMAAAIPYNPFYWGQCTWWAANVRPDIGSHMSGNAANWIWAAQHDPSLRTGYAPEPNAIVVYPAGDQGAWYAGHVAHVLSVAPDGQTFTVDEMNFPIPGVVTHRVSHVDPRIVFIY